MPQVQVALRALAAGKTVRVNDVISYITTAATEGAEGGKHVQDAAAKRAYAPMDVTNSAGALKPDIDWYLAKQLFPPIERLCAPISGTDSGQLAECLGLDPRRYAMSAASANRGDASALDLTPLESQLPDAVRYRDCPRLSLTCTTCKHKFEWAGLVDSDKSCITPKGILCPQESCGKVFKTLTLVAQVEHAIRNMTSEYYDSWMSCDDESCEVRSRGMSVYGHRCLGPQGLAKGCLGKVKLEKNGAWVGRTLSFWKGCFDVEKGREGKKVEEVDRIKALAEWNRARFETVKGVVEGYEKRCGWIWVQMDALFSFAAK